MGKRDRRHQFRKLFRKPQGEASDRKLKQLAESSRPLVISLTNDFAFKKTFRNKTALTGLLSSLLDIPPAEIVSLEFPDPFLHGEYAEDREGILDVKVHLNHSKKINIEIQVRKHPYWAERSLFYLSRMYAEDFLKGKGYDALEMCIHISILDFSLKGAEHFYSDIQLMDKKTGQVYSDKISLRVLYLNKLDECEEEEKKTEIYHWAKLITTHDWKVLREMAKRNKYMKEAVEEMERLNADKELRYLYLMRLKAASDKTTMENYYKQLEQEAGEKGLEEGHRKGLEEGRRKGLEEGHRKGLEKGLEEGRRSGLETGIKAVVLDNLEDGKDAEAIIRKLQSRFGLAEDCAASYFEKYSDIS